MIAYVLRSIYLIMGDIAVLMNIVFALVFTAMFNIVVELDIRSSI